MHLRHLQIQDNILGIFGKEEKTGKSSDSDIEEGKKTLLICEAMEKGTGVVGELEEAG